MVVTPAPMRVSIESMCTNVTSGGTPSRAEPSFWDEGVIPWFKTGELKDWYVEDAEEKITAKAIAKSSAKIFPPNTLLMAMYGDGRTITSLGILRSEAATNQACCAFIVDPTKTNFLYLFYALMHHRHELLQLVVAGAQRNLSGGIIRKFSVTWFPLTVQNRVADILSAYDDLIENNRRRMALLEESARLIYREWFVRLRFPGYEHTPIVDGVPQGWERKTLAQLTSFLKRGITPTYDDDAEGLVVNQKCIRDGRVNLELARNQSKEVKPERELQIGDVLVNSTGEGTLGRVAQVKVSLVNCTVDTHVTIVRPNESVGRHYFGQAVMDWEPRFSTMGKGATNQTELSPAAIGATDILMPPHTLLEQFETFAEPLYEQVSNLTGQNQKLRAARDLLLPRLMSGELAV